MLTGDLAQQLGVTVGALQKAAKAFDVEKRCGRMWWTPETIELAKQEMERLAEVRRVKAMYPRSSEVASRLGVREDVLRSLIHNHGLRVEKDKTGKVYQWTEAAVAAAKALLEDLASRPPTPVPQPSGLTSKEVAARLKMAYASLIAFARSLRKRHPALQPVCHRGAYYWREEDVAILGQALAEYRAKPDLRQAREAREQKVRLALLRGHAEAIEATVEQAEGMPHATQVLQHIADILTLSAEIEAASNRSLTFISTLPAGWTLRHPLSVWVREVTGGFEAVPVDFDLRTIGKTRQGATHLLRHTLCTRYQELAKDPAQDAATWTALQHLLIPPQSDD